jgi:hypothetical protein
LQPRLLPAKVVAEAVMVAETYLLLRALFIVRPGSPDARNDRTVADEPFE